MTTTRFWLAKTEPETYSIEQFLREKKTNWNGVRNFQARNFLKEMRVGDTVLIYHSGKERAVVGLAEVARAAYPDPDPEMPGDWVQVDLAKPAALPRAASLSEVKAERSLNELLLLKQSRLSVMPIPEAAFKRIVAMATLPRQGD